MEQLKFCRVCLVTDVKMYSLDMKSKDSIGVIYLHLAQIQISNSHHHVCFECASLLQKCQVFKSKCLRAHSILTKISDNSTVLTKHVIEKIDRKKNKLESNLILTSTKIYCEPCKIVHKYFDNHHNELGIKSEENIHSHKTQQNNESCFKNNSSDFATFATKNYNDFSNNLINKNPENSIGILKVDIKDNQLECVIKSEVHVGIHEESNIINKTSENNKNSEILAQVKDCKDQKRVSILKPDASLEDNNDFLDDLDDNCLVETSDDNLTERAQLTAKVKSKKEHKSKKRKMKTVLYSDDDFSDNEPLSRNISKISVKSMNKKLRLDLEFDEYATVELLTSDDAKKELLTRKESKNYKISPFKCDFCYKGYEAKTAYENHIKRHSPENGEYECEICHLRFPKPEFLCKHKLSCHKRKFSCKLCPYICYCMYQARTHVSLHKGKKYPCKDCGEIFSMPNSLFMHKRLKHLNESVAESVCELCGDIFGSPRGLFLHNNKLHRTEKNDKQGPKCEVCCVHFTSELAWKRHLVLSTRHLVTNGCKYCGERFKNEDELKSHVRANHQRMPRKKTDIELPASCPLCKEWLSNRLEYKNHMNKEHPESEEAIRLASSNLASYVCEVCGQAFKLQCFLTYHQRKHTGERPYKCEECGKSFQMSGALSIHRSVHTQKISYKCDTCAKVFSSKSALNKHMKLHLGIRPHKCTICDKGFLHMCDLRLHIKYVHDKVPWPKKKTKLNMADENTSYGDYN